MKWRFTTCMIRPKDKKKTNLNALQKWKILSPLLLLFQYYVQNT